MKKYVIYLYLSLISAIIILGIANKRPVEDIGLCIIVVILIIGVFNFFNKIIS